MELMTQWQWNEQIKNKNWKKNQINIQAQVKDKVKDVKASKEVLREKKV